jgi:hypothetical protein
VINVLGSVPDEVWIYRKFETIICAGLESAHQSRSKRFVEFWETTASSLEPAIWGTPIAKSLDRTMAKWGINAAQQMTNLQVMCRVCFLDVRILIFANIELRFMALS